MAGVFERLVFGYIQPEEALIEIDGRNRVANRLEIGIDRGCSGYVVGRIGNGAAYQIYRVVDIIVQPTRRCVDAPTIDIVQIVGSTHVHQPGNRRLNGGRFLPLQDDISSVTYWYQTLPHAPFPPLPDRNAREII
ncbi:MAG: hypothetical protein DRP64_06000 [Verrucomicrobia bacterium]|nr:MAG: hypothetical protein DRP64_06000 [Verrucomicrobiota bacterium]